MSLMNTMCPPSLCTWEAFIRSRVFNMKTAPHAGLSLPEIDRPAELASFAVHDHVKLHSCCGAVCAVPDANYTRSAGCFRFG